MEINKTIRLPIQLIWLVIYFIGFIVPCCGQQFQDPYFVGAPGTDATIKDIIQIEDTTYMYGTYNSVMTVDGFEVSHHNQADVFLIKRVNGQTEWVFHGGSDGVDESRGLALDDDNNVVIGGSFWNEAQFANTTLQSSGSSKAIFVLKLNTNGNVITQHIINSTGTKNIAGLAIVDNEIYVNGNFGDTLFVDTTAVVAEAELDIFLLHLNDNNGADWITHFGIEGKNDAIDFSWQEAQQQFIVSGQMSDKIAVAGDTIQTNTFDEDVFLAAFSKEGQGKWISKAGGQFDDFVSAHCTDDEGNIYITGSYRGIIDLDDGSEINTGGIMNVDAYIIKFSSVGGNIWARSLGSTSGIELGTGISFGNGKIYWSGYYSEVFNIDHIDFSHSLGLFSGAVGIFDTDGQINNGFRIKSSSVVVPLGIYPSSGDVILYGDFKGILTLDIDYDLGEKVYGFAVRLSELIVGSSEILEPEFSAYPNPTSHIFNIKLNGKKQHVYLYNIEGKLMYQSPASSLEHQIDVSRLGDGIYFWRSEAGVSGKMIKK